MEFVPLRNLFGRVVIDRLVIAKREFPMEYDTAEDIQRSLRELTPDALREFEKLNEMLNAIVKQAEEMSIRKDISNAHGLRRDLCSLAGSFDERGKELREALRRERLRRVP